MNLKSMLVSDDQHVLSIMPAYLEAGGHSVEIHHNADDAIARLEQDKVDTVLIDCDQFANSEHWLTTMRQSAANKRAIAIALASGANGMKEAFRAGATFSLQKPLAREITVACIRAASSLALQERRHNARFNVRVPLALRTSEGDLAHGTTMNLSSGGASFTCPQTLLVSHEVQVSITLPRGKKPFIASCVVAWSNPRMKKYGVRFLHVQGKSLLESWLLEQFEGSTGR